MQFNFDIEDIKYIKILYKDSNNNPNIIQAALRKIDENNLYACTKVSRAIDIDIPQEVVLSIICNDGLYRTKTILNKMEYDVPYTYIKLRLPHGMEYQQNREFFRVTANFPCKYIYQNKEGMQEYQTETCNISANGVTIIMPELAISKRDCDLSIMIAGCEIVLKAKYVRHEKYGNNYKISFAYTGISDMDRDLISQICIKRQLEERRK